MNHAIELANFPLGVRNHREVNIVALSLLDVLLPPQVGVCGVNGQTDDFDASLVELRFNLSYIPELGCADWCKIFGMREEDAPAVPQPVMKLDPPRRRVCLEVRGDVTESNESNWCRLFCIRRR